MDEDELEMLQEARARLANTQGKKAKRKDRERMLAQAKRLADLQKRRELKAAGLLSQKAATKARKRNRDIDLGVEIPFHKPAPAGLHDTSGEATRAESIRQKRWKSIDYKQINEQQYKTRDREAAQMRKREETRLKVLQDSNEKYKAAKETVVEERPARPRVSLQLPEPGITDQERQSYAKQQQQHMHQLPMEGEGATAALLGDYTERPLPTPLRTTTASRPQQVDLVQRATQLRRLQEGQTPLLPTAGDVEEDPMDMDTAGDDSKKPAAVAVAATPLVQRRDELGLNSDAATDARSVATFATSATDLRALARQERRAAKRARQELTEALNALPMPQYDYEVAVPTTVTEDEDDEAGKKRVKQDRADIEADEEQAKRDKIQKEYERRSTVVKRSDMPRPGVTMKEPASLLPLLQGDSQDALEQVVHEEALKLIAHDAHEFPQVDPNDKKAKKRKAAPKKKAPPHATLSRIPDNYLEEARALLDAEMNQSSMVNVLTLDEPEPMIYTEENGWVPKTSESTTVASLKLEFETLQSAVGEHTAKNNKLSKKLQVVNGGYEKRASQLRAELLESFSQLRNAEIEEGVFARLLKQEQEGGANRLASMKELVAQLREQEAALQKQYGSLVVEKRRLTLQAKAGTA